MQKCFIILLVVFVALLSSCKKETSTPLDFSQITVTDSSCIYISEVDVTDWAFEAGWTTQENDLLNFARTVSVTDSIAGYVQLSAACPNPSAGKFIVGINTERACVMKVAIVDTDMHVLYFANRVFTGGPILTAYDLTSLSAFHANENYRMYYAFYTSKDSLYYKGHGDFRIE